MVDPWQECFDHAVAVAREAGAVIRDALQKDMKITCKSCSVDLVTQTDQMVEQIIIASVKERFPSHSFIGEESVAAGQACLFTDNPTWIVDPVDGTTNFVHGFPFVAVSISLAVNKELEFGVVYSCIEDKMYTGRKGKGSFCNGERLQVSNVKDIKKSLIITEFGSNRDAETVSKIFSTMQKILCIPVHGLRGLGTAAVNMCTVASGSAEAYFEMGMHCWDVAAGAVILTEAGGVLLDVDGGPFDLMSRRIVSANNKTIAERVIREIDIISVERDDVPRVKKLKTSL